MFETKRKKYVLSVVTIQGGQNQDYKISEMIEHATTYDVAS